MFECLQEEGNGCSSSSHEVVQVKDSRSKNRIKKEKQIIKNNFDYTLEVENGSSISKEVCQTLKTKPKIISCVLY